VTCVPKCRSTAVRERPERTAQGYRRFRCLDCAKQFNERSGGLLNRTQYPSDVIALVVLWRLRYKLSLRDLAEMFLIRGFVFTYEAVRDWEAKLTPVLAEQPSTRYRTFVTPSQRKAAIRYSGSDPWGRTGHAGWLLHEDRVMFA
jgi:transposase-like protein